MFNQITVIGNIGRDAELRKAGSSSVSNFTLATKESWTDKDGNRKEVTEWHTIEVWGKQAETLTKWLEKGRQVVVIGKLTYNKWEKDGVKHEKAVIRATDVKLLGSGGSKSESRERSEDRPSRGGGRSSEREEEPFIPDDDIPF